ncbi:hypothetical protein DPEC_G00041170 [Dallia pectoralis]|uniref:Uncharacterized protein n=1 Tax=Dallia pectoralis TaxID=75939 RepID=A0ACC2HEV1_DALPE|nr:hypothetical protein DPEC_G00041170 [Dallia pectoralis]
MTVSKAEANALGCIIKETVHWILPDAILALTGGFRRGKECGHDVDFLLTTSEVGKEECLLPRVIDRFQDQGILLYCEHQGATYDTTRLPSCNFEAMDHFEKCFLILRLYEDQVEGGLLRDPGNSRSWKAVRVDLVVPPADSYATALLGWTGSRQFVRDLRRFARMERRMLFDNHALYDKTKSGQNAEIWELDDKGEGEGVSERGRQSKTTPGHLEVVHLVMYLKERWLDERT